MIQQLDCGKSVPSFSSPIKLIKISAHLLAPILSRLFNLCFTEGKFPDALKIAEILPIYKSGTKTSLTNYRPISLLSPFSKLLEKCIYTRLHKYFEKNHILYSCQFGFRNNMSTENAVVQIIEQLSKNIDKKEDTCSIFVDLRKAFDTVDHGILISKLEKYGVRGSPLKLITSFVTNRKQYTLVNGFKSMEKGVVCGVPQGSTLGPLLFLTYINDLYLASSLKLNLFADDAYLSSSNSNPRTLEREINTELDKIYNWLNINKLSLNIEKTNYLIFTPPKNSYQYNISIGNQIIKRANQVKYLGVIILTTNFHGNHTFRL